MRRAHAASLLAVGLGLVAAVGLWLSRDSAAASPAAASAEDTAGGGSSSALVSQRTETPPARTPASPALELALLDAERRPARGQAFWVVAPQPFGMPPFREPPLDLPSTAQQRTVEGRAWLSIPARHWTWLAVQWERPAGSTRFVRLDPFEGAARLELALEPGRHVLHAFVVGEDLRAPARGSVAVKSLGPLTQPGPSAPGPSREVACDAHGYARFDGLLPGRYLVSAPGASYDDRFPHAAACLFAAPGVPLELTVVLAAPGPRVDLTLAVQTPADAVFRPPAFLLLERKDDGSGQALPIPGPVVVGTQVHRLRVAPGVYQVGCVPVGTCALADDRVSVAAGGPAAATIRLSPSPARATLELADLAREELPVQVYVEPAGELVTTPADLLYLGPLHWQEARQEVGPPPWPCRMIVKGRGRCWLAREVLDLRPGSTAAVALTPATQLSIRWTDSSRALPHAAIVVAETALGTLARGLQRQLVGQQAVLAGALVVPFGEVRLSGQAQDAAELAWTRTVRAQGALLEVAVSGLR